VLQNKDGGVKLFNLFGRFSFLLFIMLTASYAGSFEEFQQTQSKSYKKFKDPRDNGFEQYLKSQWQEYQAYITQAMFVKPKPKQLPALIEKPAPKVGPSVLIHVPSQVTIEKEKPLTEKKVAYDISIAFYGLQLGFTKDTQIVSYRFYPHTQTAIASFFQLLANSQYATTLQEIKNYQRQLQMTGRSISL